MKRRSTIAKFVLTTALALTMMAGTAFAVGTPTSSYPGYYPASPSYTSPTSSTSTAATDPLAKVLVNPRPSDAPRDGEMSILGYAVHQATTKSSVTIYESSDENGTVAITLKAGVVCTLLGAPVNGWQKILIGNKVVYAREESFFTVGVITVPAGSKIGKVKANAVIREGASGSAKEIASAQEGAEIMVIASSGSYYIVHFATQDGVKVGFILQTAVQL